MHGRVGLSRGEDVRSILVGVLLVFGLIAIFLGGGEGLDVFGLFKVRWDLLDVLLRLAHVVSFGLRAFWIGITVL